ncbi:MAG: T9SS type A sorting domain-containing protein, partial [Aureispira sp.]
NAAGCDSIVTLDLTINTTDATFTNTGNTLTANTIGAAYQWLDCDSSNAPILGETGVSFTPLSDGNYALVAIQNGCTDTSTCLLFTGIGIQQLPSNPLITLYPNPTTGQSYVDLGEIQEASIHVYGIDGKLLQVHTTKNTSLYQLDLKAAAGVYIIQVITNQSINHFQLIKQ